MKKHNNDPMKTIREIIADEKYSAASLKRMLQYILMKHDGGPIKPAAPTGPEPKPSKTNTRKRRSFLREIFN